MMGPGFQISMGTYHFKMLWARWQCFTIRNYPHPDFRSVSSLRQLTDWPGSQMLWGTLEDTVNICNKYSYNLSPSRFADNF